MINNGSNSDEFSLIWFYVVKKGRKRRNVPLNKSKVISCYKIWAINKWISFMKFGSIFKFLLFVRCSLFNVHCNWKMVSLSKYKTDAASNRWVWESRRMTWSSSTQNSKMITMTNDKNKPLTRMCLAREIKKRKPSESHVKCFKLLRQLTPAIKPICDLDGNYKFSSTFRSHSNSEIVFLLLSNGGISVVHAGKRKQLDEINSFISSRLGIGGRTRLSCKNVKKNYQNYTARNEVSGTALKSFT